ncbi:hypothetical protein FS749_014906 [Ceratobasidium sp. UAMH 11750]|nr:hypothetical protein FS749_014906 [Ceratobasidium sp. UAMH 11750]
MTMAYYDDQVSAYSRDYKEIGNRVGLALIGVTGLGSAVSTFALLIYISRYAFFSKDENSPLVRGLRSFTHSALGAFLYSLLVSDLIQGAAFAVNFKWAVDGGLHHSAACTAQGGVSQFGDLGGALWSLAIAYYTFSSVVLYGLVYLRFSGLLYFEHGRLVWKKSENGFGLGCLVPCTQRDTTTISFHGSGESGSNGTRPPNTAEFNGVGKHLKKIARRLMLYPLGERSVPLEIPRAESDNDRRIDSIFVGDCAGGNLPTWRDFRLECTFSILFVCWGKRNVSACL